MRGLDPRIHPPSQKVLTKMMDCRVISAFTRVFDALLPANAVAIGVDVQEIGASVRGCALGALDRAFELVRLLDHLALDAERFGGLGVVDVGVAEIAGHVAAALELAAAVMPDAIALVVVAAVVEHDIDDRRLVTL